MANLALQFYGKSPLGMLRKTLRQRFAVYLISLSLVIFGFILRAFIGPTLGDQALYLFLVPPVLVAGVVGGWGPGVLATATSVVLHLYMTGEYSYLLDPKSPLYAVDLSRAVTFIALGIGIAYAAA